MAGALYVETEIHAAMDRLWQATQDPRQHQRWDLRFTEIVPLPPVGASQRFRYATRPLPFLTIGGIGVHTGERQRPDGSCTSALRFASAHPMSPIRDGSGYWRYTPAGDRISFRTGYDYRPRWGTSGRIIDALVLRPWMRWATAWSFDRLRIWLETGLSPEAARNRALADVAVRGQLVLAAGAVDGRLGIATAVCLALAPPLATTPAARRCRRKPARPIHAPRVARTLPQPMTGTAAAGWVQSKGGPSWT